jgi:hypothetical protein
MTEEQKLTDQLNAPLPHDRLQALRELKTLRDGGQLTVPARGRDVNNHIHTCYSFSPYSPAKAVWMADQAGLSTAGIMDHDSIGGAREFTEAGGILKLPTTIGAECRASFAGTPLEGRRINNPDQSTVAYVALHGVPHSQIDALAKFFEPVRQARAIRNREMTNRLNALLQPAGIRLDYDHDVVPLSSWSNGGEITERHLLFAVATKLMVQFGVGEGLVKFLTGTLQIPVEEKAEKQLTDPDNPHLAFDLLGVLKSSLVEKFYIDATAECPPVSEVAAFAKAHGIVLAYAYLGDVTRSVTGDKKAQTFEDDYLDELFGVLGKTGFNAVTYMPSRNTRDQLVRLRALCDRHGLFQISGEDINQPRQKFVCEAMRDPFFANLYDAAWALIGHERLATANLEDGMFSGPTTASMPALAVRISHFRDSALALYGKTE